MSEAAAVTGFARLLSDERLTSRAVGGDERAFAAIFRRYHQGLYRFCLAIVGNPEDAQDALQNTMIKVLRALPGEERRIELKPWLYRIAHNESIDLLRRRRETRALDVEQIAPGYGLAEDAATRERLRRLLADLKELPERQREVLVMRELAGLDFEEIATALATSGAAARQTLYEARQSLRQMEEGREMSCDVVTKTLSDGDGRMIRRRDVRAHLRSCASCRAFREEIESREREFAALSPLPVVAAAGMLQGLLGGAHGVGGGMMAALGGGAAKAAGASAVAKGVATAAVVAAIGVTAADRGGVINLGLPGEQNTQPVSRAPAADVAGGGSKQFAGGRTDGAVAGRGQRAAAADPAARRGGRLSAGHGGRAASGVSHPSFSAAVEGGRTPAIAPAPGGGGSHPAEAPGASTHPRGEPSAGARGYGPGVDHPNGPGHEKQHPPASSQGEETAAAHQPISREPRSGSAAAGDSSSSPQSTPGNGPPPEQAAPGSPAAAPAPSDHPPGPADGTTSEDHPAALSR
ncbi:MAG: sigma-70 family RNA polymerase sigma factor [Solirubrobacterales bacterium]